MPPTESPNAAAAGPPPAALADLAGLVRQSEGFPALLEALRAGRSGTIDGTWGSAAPLACAALLGQGEGPLVVVLAHEEDVDDFRDDLASFGGIAPEAFPATDAGEKSGLAADEAVGERLRVLKRLRAGSAKCVIAPISALLQPVPSVAELQNCSRRLQVGDSAPVEELIAWLIERGMTRVEVVEIVGEFSLRGGILDLFPPDASEPVRVEFFGDEIESIRPFDPGTQRSMDRWDSVTITAPLPTDPAHPGRSGHLTDHLPRGTWIVLAEPNDLREEAQQAYRRGADRREVMYPPDVSMAKVLRFPTVVAAAVAPPSVEQTARLRVESVERFFGDAAKVKAELDNAAAGERALIACHGDSEARRLAEVFEDTELAKHGRLALAVGHIRHGFRLVESGLLVIGDHELFSRPEARRGHVRRSYESRAIDSFLDLNEGDYVVHVNHGIAHYRGLHLNEHSKDHGEEALVLEFAEGAKLYVPIAKVDLVQKYVGGGRGHPHLSKIGSSAWERKKQRVAGAVLDLAQELIDLQAKRASQPGHAYPPEDSHAQVEFEASFPYEETPDQLASIAAVKGDLALSRPMDRLLCGDVGYGKTEVAIRAAFKVVESGKQVAVLVPTTVLCEQHGRSFAARMAEHPFLVEAVNRFRPRGEVKRVLKAAAEGKVDVLIGTHRILSKDVAFRDLGLIIVDEEQRFGVEDKEWLKTLRATVDVLTLSATPIPRTLHMSLLGLRDISNLETPPPDRKAIETRIARFDPETVRRAIRRELGRGGQVYFVHTRVGDIHALADRIQGLVPEARIVVGHGQMAGHQLEEVMLKFIRHEADILVSTTIIESGLDIPNANTMFVNEADKYGLADLHQLRGRVGRSKVRAYAYFLLEDAKVLNPNALKRLKAIEEFTELGAGFKIALRDLEIRGAGNILGAEQSGHIESVGYELYCSLLEVAVRRLTGQGEPERAACAIDIPCRAYFPKTYVPSPKLKLELYRRLSRIRALKVMEEFRQELADRFGPPPPPAEQLLQLQELRLLAARWSIDAIRVEHEYLVLIGSDPGRLEALKRAHPRDLVRLVDEKTAYVPLDGKNLSGAVIAESARHLLLGQAAPAAAEPAAPGASAKARRAGGAKGEAKAIRIARPARRATPAPPAEPPPEPAKPEGPPIALAGRRRPKP